MRGLIVAIKDGLWLHESSPNTVIILFNGLKHYALNPERVLAFQPSLQPAVFCGESYVRTAVLNKAMVCPGTPELT